MNMGNKISSRRRELGLTQQELADKLFVSVKTISKWETNRGNPEMNILPQLAKVLDLNISDLFDETNVNHELLENTERKNIDIVNVCIESGIAFFGLIFYFMTFLTFTTTLSQVTPWDSSIFDYNDMIGSTSITINVSGYSVLFKMNATNLFGFLVLLGIWVSFLSILVHIGLGIVEFLDLRKDMIPLKNKVRYMITFVELAAIMIAFISSLFVSFGIGFGMVMLIILYIAILVYRIYEKKVHN